MKNNGILPDLLWLLVVSLGFQTLLKLPVVEHRIQLPELLFIPASFLFIYQFRKSKLALNTLDYAVLFYLSINILSTMWNGSRASYLESIGRTYLVLVYVTFRWVLSTMDQPSLKKWIFKSFYTLGVSCALISLTGWLMAMIEDKSNLIAQVYENYPYFGDVYRISGITPTPTMVIILLAFPVFLVFEEVLLLEKNKTRNMITLAILLTASLLTFSKTFLLVFLGIILLYIHHRLPGARKYRPVLIGGITVLFIVSTHFLFFKTNSSWNEKLKNTPFTTNEILFSNDQFIILESFYLFAKRCALAVGQQNPVLGVGPGNFNQALDNLDEDQLTGLRKLKNFDPHSTYFGGFAETGILGLLSILPLFYLAIIKMNKVLDGSQEPIWYCLLMIVLLFLIESISTDIMNFRNLWIILGIISGIELNPPNGSGSPIGIQPTSD